MLFKDRTDAGKKISCLLNVVDLKNTIILALPRGGIPLAIEISKRFNLPLDVVLAKKIGHPNQPEFAIGSISENGDLILNQDISIDSSWLKKEEKRIIEEINKRRKQYSKFIEKQELKGKDIILVDDGIATGMTMFSAIDYVKKENVRKITVAVPIIPQDTYLKLKELVDEVVAIDIDKYFLGSVGSYYEKFPQVSDQEILEMFN